jgi:hypothetical protein
MCFVGIMGLDRHNPTIAKEHHFKDGTYFYVIVNNNIKPP